MVASFSAFTPHARGSTRSCGKAAGIFCIYPACAGITLCRSSAMVLFSNLPRMRGDQPASGTDRADMPAFTPQARGSTLVIALSAEVVYIYPACAGINLGKAQLLSRYLNLPRMRGDQPNRKINRHNALHFTPHARGSIHGRGKTMKKCLILPACAGIIPLGH